MEKGLPLTIVVTRDTLKMEAHKPYIVTFEDYKAKKQNLECSVLYPSALINVNMLFPKQKEVQFTLWEYSDHLDNTEKSWRKENFLSPKILRPCPHVSLI